MILNATIVNAEVTLDDLSRGLLIGSLVMLVAVAAVRLSTRSGMPSLLIYLGLGLLLGNGGFGIAFDSASITEVLGYAALILILAEGGLTTRWSSIRHSVAPAAVLSTVGVAVSVLVVALAIHEFLNLSWTISLMMAAIVSSTDAAAVFSVLRNVSLPRRLSGVLEAESGFNDAPVVILVVAFASQAMPGGEEHSWWELLYHAGIELAGGSFIGLLIGWLGGKLLGRVAGGSSALFSIGVISLTILAYAAASSLHFSGFIATYLSALVLGNMGLPNRAPVQSFATAMGWIAQIGLFVMLGLLADPTTLHEQIWPAIVIGLVLLLLARPLSVAVSMTPFRLPWREQAFLSWAGLRGAVPIVLATVPLTMGAPNADWIFDLVFMLVVIFTLVQGPTLPWMAKKLKLSQGIKANDVDFEATPLVEMGAEVIHVTVNELSKLHGVALFELRLPRGSNVTLIVRDGEGFVPDAHTTIRHGDELLVVTTSSVRRATVARIHDVSARGRLAGWDRD